jgi:hypothetical protein
VAVRFIAAIAGVDRIGAFTFTGLKLSRTCLSPIALTSSREFAIDSFSRAFGRFRRKLLGFVWHGNLLFSGDPTAIPLRCSGEYPGLLSHLRSSMLRKALLTPDRS